MVNNYDEKYFQLFKIFNKKATDGSQKTLNTDKGIN